MARSKTSQATRNRVALRRLVGQRAGNLTPRTDSEYAGLIWRIQNNLPPNWNPEDAAKWMAEFARSIERELNQANRHVAAKTALLTDACKRIGGLHKRIAALSNADIRQAGPDASK